MSDSIEEEEELQKLNCKWIETYPGTRVQLSPEVIKALETIEALGEDEIGTRDRLTAKKILGQELSESEQSRLDELNLRLDAHLPPEPELPESVRQANEEAEQMMKERKPKRRKLRP